MKHLTAILCAICYFLPLKAQTDAPPSPIIFIYDASGSMWGQIDGQTKQSIANKVLGGTVHSLPQDQQVGLVAYGHRRKGDCEDVEFLVDGANTDKDLVVRSLENLTPTGKTPLAHSALQVIEKLESSGMKATIILITDGIESCGGDLCAVIKAAKEKGIAFRLHIVGFGLKADETEALKCAAEAGDGNYYDAADAGDLNEVLQEATNATVDAPDGNFTLFAIKNGEPIDAYVKAYKTGTREDAAQMRTYADTGSFYLPPGIYDLVVKPLEGSDVQAITVSGVESKADQAVHKTVSFDGGKFKVTTLNNGEGWDATVKIFSTSDGKIAAGGRTYGRSDEYELNPGTYDVEIKALNMQGAEIIHRFENVQIEANVVKDLTHNFESGKIRVGASSASGLVDAVVKVIDVNNKKTVASGRTYTSDSSNPKEFTLSPGNYEVQLSALGDHKGKKEVFTFEVEAGETVKRTAKF